MSKKKTLLNETTIRRFGGLAGIKPATTSNFLTEVEVGEDELADALAAGASAMADELGMDVQVDVEGGEGGEDAELEDEVGGLEDEFGELEGEEDMIDDEEDAIDDEEDALEDEEETLDELIGRILQEEDDEEDLEEEKDYGGNKGDESRSRRDYGEGKYGGNKGDESRSRRDYGEGKYGGNKGDESRSRRDYGEGKYGGNKGDESESRRDYKESRRGEGGHGGQHTHGRGTGAEDARFEGIRVLDDELLVKEVTHRVKKRLANLVKEQRRRQKRAKRRK